MSSIPITCHMANQFDTHTCNQFLLYLFNRYPNLTYSSEKRIFFIKIHHGHFTKKKETLCGKPFYFCISASERCDPNSFIFEKGAQASNTLLTLTSVLRFMITKYLRLILTIWHSSTMWVKSIEGCVHFLNNNIFKTGIYIRSTIQEYSFRILTCLTQTPPTTTTTGSFKFATPPSPLPNSCRTLQCHI